MRKPNSEKLHVLASRRWNNKNHTVFQTSSDLPDVIKICITQQQTDERAESLVDLDQYKF